MGTEMGGDWTKYNWFWNGIQSGYEPCCIFWFMTPWTTIDKEIKRDWSSPKDGYIPCPDCLVKYMEEYNGEIK